MHTIAQQWTSLKVRDSAPFPENSSFFLSLCDCVEWLAVQTHYPLMLSPLLQQTISVGRSPLFIFHTPEKGQEKADEWEQVRRKAGRSNSHGAGHLHFA